MAQSWGVAALSVLTSPRIPSAPWTLREVASWCGQSITALSFEATGRYTAIRWLSSINLNMPRQGRGRWGRDSASQSVSIDCLIIHLRAIDGLVYRVVQSSGMRRISTPQAVEARLGRLVYTLF
jgi:hypothetical protein